jgi:hypothetical protein
MTRTLGIWLDGYSFALADRLVAEGCLPNLAALRREGARVPLDHGDDRLTGLAGEHLSSGRSPAAAGRASAVTFDPRTYEVVQEGRLVPTLFGRLPIRTVLFDATYAELGPEPTVRGLTDWGAHDPGGGGQDVPDGLGDEVVRRFGSYPAREFLYATPWASPQQCRRAGEQLTAAVRRRSDIAAWLLTERLPDWDLAIVGVSETHSALEAMWHGVDPDHPLAGVPSAPAAGASIRSVYGAVDDLVGRLRAEVPDAIVVLFGLHGMGPNGSDVASMALLGELLEVWSGGTRPDHSDAPWHVGGDGLPMLDPDRSWTAGVLGVPRPTGARRLVAGAVRRARRLVSTPSPPASGTMPLDWMPLTRHRHRWPEMDAFAVPSFYDGRIRVNVAGREAAGRVAPARYREVLDELEALLVACVDTRTRAPVVAAFDRPSDDPLAVGPTDADLIVQWAGAPLGFDHPELGRFGPLPYRRTGGHADPRGEAVVAGRGVTPRAHLPRSAYDLVPTLLELAGTSAGVAGGEVTGESFAGLLGGVDGARAGAP